jgi:hypothetical protein
MDGHRWVDIDIDGIRETAHAHFKVWLVLNKNKQTNYYIHFNACFYNLKSIYKWVPVNEFILNI